MQQPDGAEFSYTHAFPAIRGSQAGRAFYVAMCPLKVIPKIFVFDEEEVPPELRAQRALNRARIPEIANYLVENRESYVLSALTACVDGRIEFRPLAEHGPQSSIGILSVPMDARILINDGQHRRAAIEAAIRESPDLGQDNVPVLFFLDQELRRSQQMFADLNKYAIRPSYSLSTLYDHRDPSAELARYLAKACPAFSGATEMEKSAISNRSTKLFTLSSIKHASRTLLRKRGRDPITEEEKLLAKEFWDTVAEQVADWRRARDKIVPTSELRQGYVHAHGVALQALGRVGAALLAARPKDWKAALKKIKNIDWSRSNTKLWEGRAMVHGRISKSSTSVALTANAIKKAIGLKLTEDELALEREIA